MVSLTERLVLPIIGAGAVWIMGRVEGHGKGFQTYVRYMAAIMFVSVSSFAWSDIVFPGHPIGLALICSAAVMFIAWYRHFR